MIDVCKTCSRVAQWPFCVHRQEYVDKMYQDPKPDLWYETVKVREC